MCNPAVVLFRTVRKIGIVPTFTAINSKLISCFNNNCSKCINHLHHYIFRNVSLTFIFDVKKNRIIKLSFIKSFYNYTCFCFNLLDRSSITIFINSYWNLVFNASFIISFKSRINHVSFFCNSENSKTHSIISYGFPIYISLVCRNINSFNFAHWISASFLI